MEYKDLVTIFVRGWNFTRGETMEILNALDDERLHHGQFISYFTLAGFELPKGFKSNWDL